MTALGMLLSISPAITEENAQPYEVEPRIPADASINLDADVPEWTFVDRHSKSSPPFDLRTHFALGKPARACANQLIYAVYVQDFANAARSAAHFDNCAFAETLAYIRNLEDVAAQDLDSAQLAYAKVKSVGEQTKDKVLTGLFRLGQVLHAVQDFYSHSNYVELAEQRYERIQDIPALNFFSGFANEYILSLVKDHGLASGTWPIGVPRRCPSPALTHQQLAKDSDAQGKGRQPSRYGESYYYVATALAKRSTEIYIDEVVHKWPVVSEACDVVLGINSADDLRKQ